MPKKSALLVVAYLDDLDAIGRTPVNYNQGTMNPTPKFKGISLPQGRDQQLSGKIILAAAQKQVGASMKLALGYEDQGLKQQVTYLYDTARFINQQVEIEALKGYGKFWEFQAKAVVVGNNSEVTPLP